MKDVKYQVWVEVKLEKVTGDGTPSPIYEEVPLEATRLPIPVCLTDREELAGVVAVSLVQLINRINQLSEGCGTVPAIDLLGRIREHDELLFGDLQTEAERVQVQL